MRIKGIISEPGKGSYCIDIVIGAEDSDKVSELRRVIESLTIDIGQVTSRAENAERELEKFNRHLGV